MAVLCECENILLGVLDKTHVGLKKAQSYLNRLFVEMGSMSFYFWNYMNKTSLKKKGCFLYISVKVCLS